MAERYLDFGPGDRREVLEFAANDIVARSERIRLSERDAERVLELLENPPEPTAALPAAARRRTART